MCRLNIQWLRSKISLVSQMPILFPVSIRTNIAMGKKDATFDDIRVAAASVCYPLLPTGVLV
jgi:ABC-type multidrug transport system fused ATPase/permease subunit